MELPAIIKPAAGIAATYRIIARHAELAANGNIEVTVLAQGMAADLDRNFVSAGSAKAHFHFINATMAGQHAQYRICDDPIAAFDQIVKVRAFKFGRGLSQQRLNGPFRANDFAVGHFNDDVRPSEDEA